MLAAVEATLLGKDKRLVDKCDVPGILAVFERWDINDVDTLSASLATSYADLHRDLEPVAARSFLALLKATISSWPPCWEYESASWLKRADSHIFHLAGGRDALRGTATLPVSEFYDEHMICFRFMKTDGGAGTIGVTDGGAPFAKPWRARGQPCASLPTHHSNRAHAVCV